MINWNMLCISYWGDLTAVADLVITKSIESGESEKAPPHWIVASSLSVIISVQTVSQATHVIARLNLILAGVF